MDFYRLTEVTTEGKNGKTYVYPDFVVSRSKDLMVRGKSFYAVWDEEEGYWSTDEYLVQRLVDEDIRRYVQEQKDNGRNVIPKFMGSFSSNSWVQFRRYMTNISDSYHQLDDSLTFSNTDVRKEDYVSRRLPYPLQSGSIEAYDELVGTLYDPPERDKLEWAIGAIVSGDSKHIQKFLVLYGSAGTGKSTVLNIVQKLFEGYYALFDAKALTGGNNAFATEVFKGNPLVAIQHDGDLSRIEDNTKLNSITSHEDMLINEKNKPQYRAAMNAFLFMGTNKAVRITDAKSGIIRRLIDVRPSGHKIPYSRYVVLMDQTKFELGAIAQHCLDKYRQMGEDYYSTYRPVEMMLRTDVFLNFIEYCYEVFKEQNGASLTQAYTLYKQYCDEALVDFKLPRHRFRDELKNYFQEFQESTMVNGKFVKNYYSGFITDAFTVKTYDSVMPYSLTMEDTESILDDILKDCPAQYANEEGTPLRKWSNVTTALKDLDTKKLHYVKVPENHIVIDFDLKDADGEKSVEKNLEAASKWPATYSEFSKGGAGIHLHYLYTGAEDVQRLSRVYSDGIEIKVFSGDSSLRRRLSYCNNTPVAEISSGLPLKEKKVINQDTIKSEKGLRALVERNLRKEIHPGTKPSMDFIKKILDDAYSSGLAYDLTDMRPKVMSFAMNSSHQADYCIKLLNQMRFKSENSEETSEGSPSQENYPDNRVVFFDCEVFPNLFVVNWKYPGKDNNCVRMINPTSTDIESLIQHRLIGFNNRKYDNHILYARILGYNNFQLYNLSKRIVGGSKNSTFSEAYKLSYTDVYDFSSKKQSLKKFEIELGLHHQELGLPWDEPVPEELWPKVAEYCDNDVVATEATFNARHEDFVARQVLASLSGLTVNDTTNSHSSRIIFGSNRSPQSQFLYTDLASGSMYAWPEKPGGISCGKQSVSFPGYTHSFGKSEYRGENPGEGGRVKATPGVYYDVALLDVASMHPHSILALNLFGTEYTENFKRLLDARIAIKHHDLETAKSLLGSAAVDLDLKTDDDYAALAGALKIVVNSVYGLTSAKYPNPFRDERNVDNIVAKRGALFMMDLEHFVQEQGFVVAHIKTDSIKIPNATPEIIQKVMDFGKKYGYTFEHEATYSRMCLVNDAVYIAKFAEADWCRENYGYSPKENEKEGGQWTATGAQFQQPYVFKTLFSKDPIEFSDMCETKTVSTALYLDMNENLSKDEHDYQFVGKAGQFTPILEGFGGGLLMREKEGAYYAASGTKGFRWLESEYVKSLEDHDKMIDRRYYSAMVDDAVASIGKFGDFEAFID